MAFLQHAKSLALEHSGSKDWLEWFGGFLNSWEGASFRVNPSQLREFAEELKSEPAFPDVPDWLWGALAATHSAFGKIVLNVHLGQYKLFARHLDVTQPAGRTHIEKAAKRTGAVPGQIDATVESLSEYLGWDITQGLGNPVP